MNDNQKNHIDLFACGISKPIIFKNIFDENDNFIEQRAFFPDDKDYEKEYLISIKERKAKECKTLIKIKE